MDAKTDTEDEMTAMARMRELEEAPRHSKELAPLIKEQVEMGDLAAEEAGMPFYREAGGLLEEARLSKKIAGEYSEDWFEEYCRANTKTRRFPEGRGVDACGRWIRAHREKVAALEHTTKKGKSRPHGGPRLSNTLDELRGQSSTGRVFREWTAPVDDLADMARRQQARAAEDRETEQKRKQQLARKLIDIGFKVLAKELHPDKMGGSNEAMVRLSEVRKALMRVYG